MQKNKNNALLKKCRANGSLIKERSVCSTKPGVVDVSVTDTAEIIVTIGVCLPSPKKGPRKRREYSASQIRDLRQLASSAACPNVQRAATAVFDFANGKSYAECAKRTPYGEGWVRGAIVNPDPARVV